LFLFFCLSFALLFVASWTFWLNLCAGLCLRSGSGGGFGLCGGLIVVVVIIVVVVVVVVIVVVVVVVVVVVCCCCC